MERALDLIDFNRYYIGSPTLSLFLIDNAAKIDWDDLADWAEKVWEQDGYEWLYEIDSNGPGSWKSSEFKKRWENGGIHVSEPADKEKYLTTIVLVVVVLVVLMIITMIIIFINIKNRNRKQTETASDTENVN